MQYNALDMLTGVTGGVVRGSRVYLIHLACACSIGIWRGSLLPGRRCGACRGGCLLRDINVYEKFACIYTVALLIAFVA